MAALPDEISDEAVPPRRIVQSRALPECYEIRAGERLPEFDTSGGMAYVAVDHDRPDRYLYALVHKRSVPHRDDVANLLISRKLQGINRAIQQGTHEVTRNGRKVDRLVTIFERPYGMSLEKAAARGLIDAAYIREKLVAGLVEALDQLHGKGIFHGRICPANIYLTDEPGSPPILGECVSVPAGVDQPANFESIERAQADPWGRGHGSEKDDFFSLGATIMALWPRATPFKGPDRHTAILARMARGSFTVLAEGAEFSRMDEVLLRGLVTDRPVHRWGADDIRRWLAGNPPVKGKPEEASTLDRPIEFHGQAIGDRRILAKVFSDHAGLAAKFLRRLGAAAIARDMLHGEVSAEEIEAIMATGRAIDGSLERGDEMLVARICALLDPSAPVIFRSMRFFPAGIGGLIAKCYVSDEKANLAAIRSYLLSPLAADHQDNPIGVPLDRVRTFVESKALGRGIERVLYDLNPGLPCLSPRMADNWVAGLDDVLQALDAESKAGDKRQLIDRHTCAFAASRNPSLERVLARLDGGDIPGGEGAAEVLGIFAALQMKHRTGPLKNLSLRFAGRLRPAIQSLKNKGRRDRLSAKLEETATSGDLARMARELNFFQEQMLDARDYAFARAQFMSLEEERVHLGKHIGGDDFRARERGYGAAALIGYAALIVVTLYMLTGE